MNDGDTVLTDSESEEESVRYMINYGESDAENSDLEEPSHELDTDNS